MSEQKPESIEFLQKKANELQKQNNTLAKELLALKEHINQITSDQMPGSRPVESAQATYRLTLQPDGGIIYTFFDGDMEIALGKNKEAPIGKSPVQVFGDALGKLIEKDYRQAFNGEAMLYEVEHLGRCLSIQLIPLFKNGQVIEVVGSTIDVTAQKLAEKEAEDTHKRLRAIFDNALDAILLVDNNTHLVDVNPAICKMLGYSRQELLQMVLTDLVPPEYIQEAQEKWQTFLQSGKQNGEIQLVCKDGSFCLAEYLTVVDILPGLHLSVLRDITEKKQTEAALRSSEQQVNLLLEKLPLNMLTVDRQGKILSLFAPNDSLQHLGNPQNFINKNVDELQLSDNTEETRAVLKTVFEEYREITYEMISPAGKWFESRVIPIIEHNKVTSAVIINIDISERRNAEADLRNSEEKFRLAMEATEDGLWDWDIETDHVYYSPGWAHILELESTDLIPNKQTWSSRIHPEDYEITLKAIEDNLEGRTPQFNQEHRLQDNQGQWKWVLGRGRVVSRKPDGTPIRMIGTMVDISERKNMEEILVASEKLAGIGMLSAGITHEINSPLQVITGACEGAKRRLETEQLTPEMMDNYLDRIERNAWRLAKIVRSLLTYARSSQGEIIICDINDLINDTLLLIEYQMRNKQNIAVTTNFCTTLPAIKCEYNKITQVLINLLINARDAMPAGGQIMIETGVMTDNTEIFIRIKDSGTGIPSEVKDKVFNPFFTTKPVGQGTGLGLSIVKEILENHNGRIELEYTSKSGSSFLIVLPAS